MRASKITACVCALALATSTTAATASVSTPAAREFIAPPAARDDAPPAAASVAAEERTVPEAVAAATSPQQRKKGNLFVRVITAPFRGLAKLFGGGRRTAKAARVSVEVTPKPTPAPAATQSAAQQQPATQSTQAAAQAAAPNVSAPDISLPTTSRPQQSAATPHVAQPAPTPAPAEAAPGPRRAAADDAAQQPQQQQQAPFIPLVVGVPRDPLSQGRALLEQGYLNEAVAELSIAAVNSENLVEANNLLGLAYDRRGWHKQAREYYERALSVAPDDPQVLNNLGYSLFLDDRYDDALDKLRRAARLSPADNRVQNNLALVYGRLRKYDDAFKHFARAGGELYARLQTGAILDFAGRDRDAIKQFEAARRLDPASTEALRRLITLYNRTGQRDKAEAAQQELDRPKVKAIS
jgi:Flp pilus assembly protein TadD